MSALEVCLDNFFQDMQAIPRLGPFESTLELCKFSVRLPGTFNLIGVLGDFVAQLLPSLTNVASWW